MNESLFFIGYSSCALAVVSVALYKLQDRLLKQKKVGVLSRRLPSLETADRWGHVLVQVGVLHLALGLCLQAQGGVSARELWLVLVGLTYSTYLSFYGAGWRGLQIQNLRLVGFLVLTAGWFCG